MAAIGRTDDGVDESIETCKFAERTVPDGIRKMLKFDTVRFCVVQKNTPEAQTLAFSGK